MEVKTNIRAGSGSDTTTSTSSGSGGASGSGQNGKVTDVFVVPVYYSRCVGA